MLWPPNWHACNICYTMLPSGDSCERCKATRYCSFCSIFLPRGSLLICASCKSTSYCCRKCQKSDWALHKVLCKDIASLSPRPSTSHKLAFFLPYDSEKPRLEWVDVQKVPLDGVFFQVPSVAELLERTQASNITNDLLTPDVHIPGENHSFIIYCRNDSLTDDAKLNQSIFSISKVRRRGHFLVLRTDGLVPPTFSDVLLADFPVLIQLMKDSEKPKKKPKNVRGVLLRCPGDDPLYSKEPLAVAVDVSGPHPIYAMAPTDVTEQMGLPLLLSKLPRRNDVDSEDEDQLSYQSGSMLNLDICPNSEMWGMIPEVHQSQMDGRGLLVMRQDKEDLSGYQLIAIAEFIGSTADYIKNLPVERSEREEIVKKLFTREQFEDYFFNMFIPTYYPTVVDPIKKRMMSPYSKQDNLTG